MVKYLVMAIAALATASTLYFTSAQAEKPGVVAAVSVNAADVSGDIVKSGVFKGRNQHVTTGGISIVKTADGYVAILADDFSLDGAPAPTLGFGKGGFDKKTEFTPLKSNTGRQVYAIPASINPADYDEFYVWCEDFSVALGVASLK